MGGWGTGKSSLLNLIERDIKRDVKVVRFNPWNYYSQQTLFASFFDELTDALKFSNKIKTLFQKYKNKIYAAGISLGSSVVPQVGALAGFISDSEHNTLNDIKDKLDEIFKNQRKTVVIIDDIDRLNPQEVKQIFQLVKSLADFPNVVYILAFDKNYVNFALKEWNMYGDSYDHSEDFIDKIIQVPLTVPKFDEDSLFKIFKEKFEKIISNHSAVYSQLDISKLYDFLEPFFCNIRNINRYCNSLDFYLYSVDTDVWIFDFALITALQIFTKRVYDKIKYEKELLAGAFNIFDGFSELNTDKDDLQIFLDDLKCDDVIKRILSELFPKVKSKVYNSKISEMELSLKKQNCSVMDEDYFDLYFTFDNTASLSQSRIHSLIESSEEGVEKLKSNILELKKMDLFERILYKLKDHSNKFSDDGIKNFINLLINDYRVLLANDGETDNSLISAGASMIVELFRKNSLDDEKILQIVSDADTNYFKIFLLWELEHYNILNNESFDEIKIKIYEFLKDYFDKTEFSEIEHPRTYIYFLKYYAGVDVSSRYVQNLKDEELIDFILDFKKYSNFYEKYIFEYDHINWLVDVVYVKKRLENMKVRKNDVYIENKELINLFLKDFETSN